MNTLTFITTYKHFVYVGSFVAMVLFALINIGAFLINIYVLKNDKQGSPKISVLSTVKNDATVVTVGDYLKKIAWKFFIFGILIVYLLISYFLNK